MVINAVHFETVTHQYDSTHYHIAGFFNKMLPGIEVEKSVSNTIGKK
jgi:hypothetical protein